ncbi:DUF5675 family protein [Pedobacter alpinus]|uniref:DUF5675 family protein n=1 Tax=Pedobacter alpinus TaxID=1590643 RepID=A0ABW5TU03_9SPHI
MKKVRNIRVSSGLNSTLSHLYIENRFICYLLEDKISKVKEAGLTCIPSGVYELQFNVTASMNALYRPRFPKTHQGMIEISGIPNFKSVFFHIGNTIKDTKGCPLTGHYWALTAKEYQVHQSTLAYEYAYLALSTLLLKQGRTKIEVIDETDLKGGYYGI